MAVSSTPILIDDAKFGSVGSFYGPYQAGGALYAVIGQGDLDAGTYPISVFKSTDSGVTWVSQDAGNKPTAAINGNYTTLFTPTEIHIIAAHLGAPNILTNSRFSLSSDLFLAPVSVTVAHTLVAEQVAILRGDGSVFVQYVISDASIEATYFNTFSSGAWGIESLLTQGTAGQNLNGISAAVDGSDTVHFLWVLTVSAVDTVKYQTIDSGGSVSASVNLPIANFDLGTKLGVVWSGVLVFPYVELGTFLARTAFGAGATTNPSSAVWTSAADWILTLPPDSTNNATAVPMLNGANLDVFFINVCASLGSQVYSVRWNGATFDPPVLFYDTQAFPPPGTVSTVFLFLISLALNSGSTQIVFGATYGGPNASTFFADGGGTQSGYRNRVY